MSRCTAAGQGQAQRWLFVSQYELLRFAHTQDFAEVDPIAQDWQKVASP